MIAAGGRFRTIEQTIGNTPLVRLQRIAATDNTRRNNVILGKLEGNNPGGSVKRSTRVVDDHTGGRTWTSPR